MAGKFNSLRSSPPCLLAALLLASSSSSRLRVRHSLLCGNCQLFFYTLDLGFIILIRS